MSFIYYKQVKVEWCDTPIARSTVAEGCPMPDAYLYGRPVYIGEYTLDGVDSYVDSATWADTEIPLSCDELGDLLEVDEVQAYLIAQNLSCYGYYRK